MSSFISNADIDLVESKSAQMLLRFWRRFGNDVPYRGTILQTIALIYRADIGQPYTELTSDMREWKYLPAIDVIHDNEPRYINRRCPSVSYYPNRKECIHYECIVYWYHIGRGHKVYFTDNTSHVKVSLPYRVPTREENFRYKLPDTYDGKPQDINGFITPTKEA